MKKKITGEEKLVNEEIEEMYWTSDALPDLEKVLMYMLDVKYPERTLGDIKYWDIAQEIGEIRTEQCVDILIKALDKVLKDAEDEIKGLKTWYHGRQETDEEAIDNMENSLFDLWYEEIDVFEKILGIMSGFEVMGEPAIIPMLELLHHESPILREKAIEELEDLIFSKYKYEKGGHYIEEVPDEFIAPVRKMLTDPDELVRSRALLFMFFLFEQDDYDLVVKMTQDPSWHTRMTALNVLDNFKREESVGIFMAAMKDPFTYVRFKAMRGLYYLDRDEAVKRAIALLEDDYWLIRCSAAKVLSDLDWEPDTKELEEIFQNAMESDERP